MDCVVVLDFGRCVVISSTCALWCSFGFGQMGGEFLDLRFVVRFGFSQMCGEFLDLRFVGSFSFSEMGRELLHLGFVQLFAMGKMRAEFLHFRFVPSFGLRKELAIQMLDLHEAVWNEGIEPAHRAGK